MRASTSVVSSASGSSRTCRPASAFGNPAFDQTLFPTLAALPGSEKESKQIRGLYPNGKVVLGAAATRERVLAEVGSWPVVHFGGHAVSNSENPFLSALVLAPAGSDTGVFYVRDLPAASLKRIRLLVLAACSTLLGESMDSGPSVAAPLLVRGVPAVMGTLWSVGDRDTEGMILDFHRRFAKEGDAARALREAQLAYLQEKDIGQRSPLRWAAYALIGS